MLDIKKDDVLFGINNLSEVAGIEIIFKVKEYIKETNTVVTDCCLTLMKQPSPSGKMGVLPIGNLGFLGNVNTITEDKEDIYINLNRLGAYGKCTNTSIIETLEQVNSKMVMSVSNSSKALLGEDTPEVNGLHFVD